LPKTITRSPAAGGGSGRGMRPRSTSSTVMRPRGGSRCVACAGPISPMDTTRTSKYGFFSSGSVAGRRSMIAAAAAGPAAASSRMGRSARV
jgi:hypothetical protein